MLRFNLIGRENRLCYRRASDFGYESTSDAKVESRDLSRQSQQQQQSNLDAQRAQQQQVDQLNAGSSDTNYRRSAGSGETTISSQTTKFDRNGNPISSPSTLEGSNLTMDRSLPQSSAQVTNELSTNAQERRNQRIKNLGIDPNDQVVSLFDQGGKYAGSENGVPIILMPDGRRVRLDGYNDSTVNKYASSAASLSETNIADEISREKKLAEQQARQQILDKQSQIDKSQAYLQQNALPQILPEQVGSSAAFANLPPEAQFLAPYLSQFQQGIQQSLAENANLTQGLFGDIEKTYGGIQSELDTIKQGYIASTEAMNGLLEEVRNNNEETIAKQRKAEEDRLAWEEYKGRSTLQKQKRDSHDAMVAQIALAGGFGQDAGIRAVMESDAEYESKMQDLAIQFTYARTDLAAKFTGLYNENQNNYISETIANTKELRSSLERIGMQSIANQTARQQAEQGIIEKAWNNQVSLRNTLATQNLNVAGQIAGMITNKRAEDRQVEQDSLAKIEYLLDNYPRETVADAIRELGKNVRSFNVETLINNPTKEEIEKAKKSVGRGGGGSGGYGGPDNYLPTEMQGEIKPSVSFDEFTNKKIQEAESKQNRSLTPEAKAKLMFENAEKWEREYNDLYVAGATAQKVGKATTDLVQQFGQPTVDAATAVLNGTYAGTNPVKNAAKAFGVSEGAVATALTRLRQNGAVVETAILSPDQQTSRNRIVNDIIKPDPFYTVWTGSKSAVTRIQTAIGDSGGADGLSDIMAINAFQNGIVDPGATVREGDVALLQTAIAWSTKWGINTTEGREYWYGKIRKGDKLPAEMRQKMLQLATATRDAYGRDFQTETVPKILTRIRQDGLPESVLDDYIGQTAGVAPIVVSPEVSSFANTYFSD